MTTPIDIEHAVRKAADILDRAGESSDTTEVNNLETVAHAWIRIAEILIAREQGRTVD